MEKEPITSQGLEKLKNELIELKNIKRPKIIEAIAEARSHGDLKENAEYHAAREEQAKIESRIIKINDLIARANVIDVTTLAKSENVIFGSTVTGRFSRGSRTISDKQGWNRYGLLDCSTRETYSPSCRSCEGTERADRKS